MSWFGKLLGTDKAIEGISDVANAGMEIWNNSDFTPQERTVAFLNLVKATASKETSISRRILLYFVIGMNAFFGLVGVMWIGLGADERVAKLLELAAELKLGYALVAALGFYYLTHVVNGNKK